MISLLSLFSSLIGLTLLRRLVTSVEVLPPEPTPEDTATLLSTKKSKSTISASFSDNFSI